MMLKHLLLDDTPENQALVEMVLEEAAKTGDSQFARHFEPTGADRAGWEYLSTRSFIALSRDPVSCITRTDPRDEAALLLGLLQLRTTFERCSNLPGVADVLFGSGRSDFDKLPADFEAVTVPFMGTMTFRGWRDLHRQTFSTHLRTLLTTHLGFYEYDKPHPPELGKAFADVDRACRELYQRLHMIPEVLRQLILPMGYKVGFVISSNLRQHEFVNWQRTKSSVNHEVRQTVLAIEMVLRARYPWWERFSRANLTPAYVFARGSQIPLEA